MTEPLVMRAYLRVSQDRSGTSQSPNQQHEALVESARRQGWTVHASPYRDNDRSASRYSRVTREGFAALMSDLEEGRFGADLLGIWESSRGSRRTGEWVDLIELCAEQGVKIWVDTHKHVYDPQNARDRRSLREDASDAEYESDKTSERLLRTTLANAKTGRPHGKKVYGYERVYDPVTRQLVEVVEHPEHGPVVREAARRVLAGESFYRVAKSFNERGIPQRRPARTEGRKNKGWTAVAIKQMLVTPAYAGLRQHRGEILPDVETVWEPLIPPEDWHRLQAVMASRSAQKSNDWPAKYLLTGIAICGEDGCGAGTRIGKQNYGRPKTDPVTGEKQRVFYRTYLCTGTPGRTGFHVAIKLEHLDLIVTETVLERVGRPDFLARIGQEDGELDADRDALLKEIAGHREWLEQVRERAVRERNLDLLFDQESRVKPLIEAAQKQLESLAATDPLVVELASAPDTRAHWEDRMDLQQRRTVIRALCVPRILRAKKRGGSGLEYERVKFQWL